MKNAISGLVVITLLFGLNAGISQASPEGSFHFPIYSAICRDGTAAGNCPPAGTYGGRYEQQITQGWITIISDTSNQFSYNNGDRIELRIYKADGSLHTTLNMAYCGSDLSDLEGDGVLSIMPKNCTWSYHESYTIMLPPCLNDGNDIDAAVMGELYIKENGGSGPYEFIVELGWEEKTWDDNYAIGMGPFSEKGGSMGIHTITVD